MGSNCSCCPRPSGKVSPVPAMAAQPAADIGLIGLAVMGQNLILNMADHGNVVCAYNRTTQKVQEFLDNEAKGTTVIGAFSDEEFISKLKKPRRIMLLVKAGKPVDDWIERLLPRLEKGDIFIDGGNSDFNDSTRRSAALESQGILFVGSGVSGGEDGARYGPSLMPGGTEAAWPAVKSIFQGISAKVGEDPCCQWVGAGGAGHYVKMVHNGIEYGDMQLICEAYHFLLTLGFSHDEMSEIFKAWNTTELDSFLIEITANILAAKDADGAALVTKIKDSAGQKGTGKWTGISALDLGVPVTLIGEAVFARCLSALKDTRVAASSVLPGPATSAASLVTDKAAFAEHVRKALYASKIISYAQGFAMLAEAARTYGWKLNFGEIALMWRGGCIIRSRFLGDIKAAFDKDPNLSNLLLGDFFKDAVGKCQESWREVVATGAKLGVPTPAFSSALAFYDGFRCSVLPANLLQAQRDYFGAHTFERVDQPGTFVHHNWTGHGGRVASTTYDA